MVDCYFVVGFYYLDELLEVWFWSMWWILIIYGLMMKIFEVFVRLSVILLVLSEIKKYFVLIFVMKCLIDVWCCVGVMLLLSIMVVIFVFFSCYLISCNIVVNCEKMMDLCDELLEWSLWSLWISSLILEDDV